MEIEYLNKPKSAFEAYKNIRRLHQHYPINVRWAHWKSDGYERDDNGNFVRWFPEPKDQKELNDWRGKNQFKPGRLFSEFHVALAALIGICPAHLQTIIHPVCTKIRNWVDAGFHTFVIEPHIYTHRLHSATEIMEWEKVGNDAIAELNLLAASFPDYQPDVSVSPPPGPQAVMQTQKSRRQHRRKLRRKRRGRAEIKTPSGPKDKKIPVAGPAFPADHYREKYGLRPNTLNKARRDGRLEGEKRGGRWFYPLPGIRALWPDVFTEGDEA
jgi:hypothetical protein